MKNLPFLFLALQAISVQVGQEHIAYGRPVIMVIASQPNSGSLTSAVDGKTYRGVTLSSATDPREERWLEIHLNAAVDVGSVHVYSTGYNSDELKHTEVRVGNQSRRFSYHTVCEKNTFNYTGWLTFTCPSAITGTYVSVNSQFRTSSAPWIIGEILVFSAESAQRVSGPDGVDNLKAEVVLANGDFSISTSWTPTTNDFHDTLVYDIKVYTYSSFACPGVVWNNGKLTWDSLSSADGQTVGTSHEFQFPYYYSRYKIEVRPFVFPLQEGLSVASIYFDVPKARAAKATLQPRWLSATELPSRSVHITWVAPDCREWRAPFVNYTLSYENVRRGICNASATSYTVTNFKPGTNYTISLSLSTELETSFDASVTLKTSGKSPQPTTTTTVTTPPPTTSTTVTTPPPTTGTTVTTPPPTTSTTVTTPPPTTTTTVTIPPPTTSPTVITPPPTNSTTVTTPPPTNSTTVTTPPPTNCTTVTTPPPTTSTTVTTTPQPTTSSTANTTSPPKTVTYALVGVVVTLTLVIIIVAGILIYKRRTPNVEKTTPQDEGGSTAASATMSSVREDGPYTEIEYEIPGGQPGNDRPTAPECRAYTESTGYAEPNVASIPPPVDQMPGVGYVVTPRVDSPPPEYSPLRNSDIETSAL